MKTIIKLLLKQAGWELHRTRTTVRNTMMGSLESLSTRGFSIKTILDVGASDGRWSKGCMDLFTTANYVLFEPQPVHATALDAFAKNHQRTTIIKKAVGSSEGHTYFDASDPFSGVLAANAGNHTIKVDLTTIDASVAQNQCQPPFLLKLDTHGFEKGILEAAHDTLRSTQALIIEAYNYRITSEALTFWELCAFMAERGFRPIDLVDVMHRPHDDSLWQMDLFFIKSTWEGFNYTSYK